MSRDIFDVEVILGRPELGGRARRKIRVDRSLGLAEARTPKERASRIYRAVFPEIYVCPGKISVLHQREIFFLCISKNIVISLAGDPFWLLSIRLTIRSVNY